VSLDAATLREQRIADIGRLSELYDHYLESSS
jgi:hypothetical protein